MPLIVVDPRKPRARDATDALVGLIDLYPTLAEFCGIEVPSGLHGRSFVSLLKNPEGEHRRYAYFSYPRRPKDDVIGHSIRSERYRNTEWWDVETREVLARVATDLIKDPGETTNLLPDEARFFAPFSDDLRELVEAARQPPGSSVAQHLQGGR